jgi:prevent-host-death family protein
VIEVNTHAAKTQLSRLLARVEAGEEVAIMRSGKPIAKLVPFRGEDAPRRRRLTASDGDRVRIGTDFDEPLPGAVRR